jgi:hypothetical protein
MATPDTDIGIDSNADADDGTLNASCIDFFCGACKG